MRQLAHILVIVLALSTLAACQTHSLFRNPTSASVASTTTGNPADVVRLRPPDFTLVSKSGKQQAIPGPYFWVTRDGVAANVTSAGFETTNYLQLAVAQNEQLTIDVSNGPYPETMDMRIYPEDGNYSTQTSPQGSYKEFQPKTNPVQTKSFGTTPYTWTANLKPGGYFVYLACTWKSLFVPPTAVASPSPSKQVYADVAFWIDVK